MVSSIFHFALAGTYKLVKLSLLLPWMLFRLAAIVRGIVSSPHTHSAIAGAYYVARLSLFPVWNLFHPLVWKFVSTNGAVLVLYLSVKVTWYSSRATMLFVPLVMSWMAQIIRLRITDSDGNTDISNRKPPAISQRWRWCW